MIDLQYIAPYLPYDVKCMVGMQVGIVKGIEASGRIITAERLDVKKRTPVKLVLKPLEVADVHIQSEFAKYDFGSPYDKEVIELFCLEFTGIGEPLSELVINQLPQASFNWLVRNKYDVFGLIDKGLAHPAWGALINQGY